MLIILLLFNCVYDQYNVPVPDKQGAQPLGPLNLALFVLINVVFEPKFNFLSLYSNSKVNLSLSFLSINLGNISVEHSNVKLLLLLTS